jgi:hypothetical protein
MPKIYISIYPFFIIQNSMLDVRCSMFIGFILIDQTGRFSGQRSAGGGTPETF